MKCCNNVKKVWKRKTFPAAFSVFLSLLGASKGKSSKTAFGRTLPKAIKLAIIIGRWFYFPTNSYSTFSGWLWSELTILARTWSLAQQRRRTQRPRVRIPLKPRNPFFRANFVDHNLISAVHNSRHSTRKHCLGRNNRPRLQPYFIGFCRVVVLQSQLFIDVVSNLLSFVCFISWLIRSLVDPTYTSRNYRSLSLAVLCRSPFD